MGGLVAIKVLHVCIQCKYCCLYDTHVQNSAAMQPLRPYEKLDTLRQFLDHDRQVLRFYCHWDDTYRYTPSLSLPLLSMV